MNEMYHKDQIKKKKIRNFENRDNQQQEKYLTCIYMHTDNMYPK